MGKDEVEHIYFIARVYLAKTQLVLNHSVTRSDRNEPESEKSRQRCQKKFSKASWVFTKILSIPTNRSHRLTCMESTWVCISLHGLGNGISRASVHAQECPSDPQDSNLLSFWGILASCGSNHADLAPTHRFLNSMPLQNISRTPAECQQNTTTALTRSWHTRVPVCSTHVRQQSMSDSRIHVRRPQAHQLATSRKRNSIIITAIDNTEYKNIYYQHLLHLTKNSWLSHIRHVDEDIIGWVAVEWGTESLLVQVVSDKSNRTSKNEQSVQSANLPEIMCQDNRRLEFHMIYIEEPTLIYSSASSGVNAPLSRRRSTKHTAIQPSTFRIS